MSIAVQPVLSALCRRGNTLRRFSAKPDEGHQIFEQTRCLEDRPMHFRPRWETTRLFTLFFLFLSRSERGLQANPLGPIWVFKWLDVGLYIFRPGTFMSPTFASSKIVYGPSLTTSGMVCSIRMPVMGHRTTPYATGASSYPEQINPQSSPFSLKIGPPLIPPMKCVFISKLGNESKALSRDSGYTSVTTPTEVLGLRGNFICCPSSVAVLVEAYPKAATFSPFTGGKMLRVGAFSTC